MKDCKISCYETVLYYGKTGIIIWFLELLYTNMKKRIFWAAILTTYLANGVFAHEAFDWAYQHNLINSSSTDQGQKNITRAQFAPILVRFIDKVALKEYQSRTCNARDLSKADQEYQSDLKKLCAYGVLNGENGSLYPLRKLTNGQAVALVMRIIDGTQDESIRAGRHWAQGYYDRASALGLDIGELSYKKNESITYEKLIKLLYNVRNQTSWGKTSSTRKTNDDPLKRLADIMES